jgi:hypothetical protein
MATESRPIFLVGAERSGTTVFRLMLAGHPEIGVCSEFEYVVDPLVGRADWPTREEFHAHLASNWIFQDHGLFIDERLAYPELAASFLAQTAARDDARLVIAVVHRHFDQIPRLWEAARYIHIVRDPRDVARSNIGMGWAGNVWHGVDRWIDVERCWAGLRATLSADRYLELRQEELIRSPERVLTEVCSFLGVPYDPAMLEYPRRSTYETPDPDLVEQWRRKLSPREIGLVESKVGDLLQAAGYVASGGSTARPSTLERAWLRIDDKLGRVRSRRRALGLRLWAADVLSRRLGLTAWQARLDPQLRARWKAGLK